MNKILTQISDQYYYCYFVAIGTTGEGLSMSMDERLKATKEWARVAKGR